MKIEKHVKKIQKYLEKIPKEEQIIVIKYIEYQLGYLSEEQLNYYVKAVNLLETQ